MVTLSAEQVERKIRNGFHHVRADGVACVLVYDLNTGATVLAPYRTV